ncbi:Nuclear transport factor 2A-like protein [Drosera capensis]
MSILCQHAVTTVDCQPSGAAGGVLVFVSGNLQLAGEHHALKFSQLARNRKEDSFLLMDHQAGCVWVQCAT